jgi:hypothetical protein
MSEDKTVTVQIKNNYGNQVVYPYCQKAFYFANIAGTRTLTQETRMLIERLGYTLVVHQENSLKECS